MQVPSQSGGSAVKEVLDKVSSCSPIIASLVSLACCNPLSLKYCRSEYSVKTNVLLSAACYKGALLARLLTSSINSPTCPKPSV